MKTTHIELIKTIWSILLNYIVLRLIKVLIAIFESIASQYYACVCKKKHSAANTKWTKLV